MSREARRRNAYAGVVGPQLEKAPHDAVLASPAGDAGVGRGAEQIFRAEGDFRIGRPCRGEAILQICYWQFLVSIERGHSPRGRRE